MDWKSFGKKAAKAARKGIAVCAPLLLSVGGLTDAGPSTSPTASPSAARTGPVAAARRDEHEEQPHAPEIDQVELAGADDQVEPVSVLTLDDPVKGLLNGKNILGYCPTCPLDDGQRTPCPGPCPGEINWHPPST